MAQYETIMIVDDKVSVLRLLADYLTVTANNGCEALYVARHEKPDLVLLATCIGVAAGTYPALRAARMTTVLALKAD